MWAGRFQKEEDEQVNDFNSSIRFDFRMYREDIAGSIAHAKMLGKQGIITLQESEKIIEGLAAIRRDIDDGTLAVDPAAEDIHMFVEEELTKRIGDAGKRLHTARSRNDQVALDTKLYLLREIGEIRTAIADLAGILLVKAEQNLDTVMPGYTHLQRAQPVTFAHHLCAYVQMLKRDDGRLGDCGMRMDEMPLGSGALAGTTYAIDRDFVRVELGFSRLTENSLDGVSDRDYVLELLAALSILMMHLSRFSEEIVLWCSGEFAFLELDDAYSTGSSIMPQKKNPDIAELVRGKTGRVYGDLVAMLTVMKGLPLAYNKDMQEDKEAVFDAIDHTKQCLEIFGRMVESAAVCAKRMRDSAEFGLMNATDCADYLVKKGMPFREAYQIVGRLVAKCLELGVSLDTLPIADYQSICGLFDQDVYRAIALSACVAGRACVGGPAKEAVQEQIGKLKTYWHGTKGGA